MVVLFSKLGKVLVDTTGVLAVGVIGVAKDVLMSILPENQVPVRVPSVGLAILETANTTVKGSEVMVETLEGHLITLADYLSLARVVRSDDRQPGPSFRAALWEQTGAIARACQGLVVDVTTQTLGNELGEAARSAMSTVGHTGSLCVATLRLRLAASPSNFVPLGPTLWKEVAHEVLG